MYKTNNRAETTLNKNKYYIYFATLFTEYVDQLMRELLFRRECNKSYAQAKAARVRDDIQRPSPIAHSTPGKRLNKIDVVNARFNR